MGRIYAFCGMSGSGKSTIANTISELLNIPFVISYTTRPIRPDEKDGVDYHFINKRQWDLLNGIGALVCTQSFNVASGEVWRYGILQDDLQDACIMVLTPSGINDLLCLGYNVTSIYIDLDENERLKRIGSRNDNQSQSEIKRRSAADRKVFDGFTPDHIIDNNGNISDTILNTIQYVI